MAKITYYTHDSKNHTIDVQNGLTVMEGAVQNDIPGIDQYLEYHFEPHLPSQLIHFEHQ